MKQITCKTSARTRVIKRMDEQFSFPRFGMSDSMGKWPADTFGVYVIRDTSSGRVSVGVTGRCFKDRWHGHRTDLRGGRHGNPVLQNAYNLRGEVCFQFEIVEILSQRDESIGRKREDFWIKRLRARVEDGGFNLRDGEGFFIRSDEMRKNQSKAAFARRGRQYRFKTPEGNVVDVPDLRAFCATRDLSQYAMAALFRGTLLSYKGYTSVESDIVPLSCSRYVFISPTGEEHITSNLKAFASQHNLIRSGLSCLASGIYGVHRGWKLKSAVKGTRRKLKTGSHKRPRSRAYRFLNPEGVRIEVADLTPFCEQHNLSRDSMVAVFNGTNTSHKGYTSVDSNYVPQKRRFRTLVAPDGKEYVTNNIAQFARDHNLVYSGLRALDQGKQKSTQGGWTLKHL